MVSHYAWIMVKSRYWFKRVWHEKYIWSDWSTIGIGQIEHSSRTFQSV